MVLADREPWDAPMWPPEPFAKADGMSARLTPARGRLISCVCHRIEHGRSIALPGRVSKTLPRLVRPAVVRPACHAQSNPLDCAYESAPLGYFRHRDYD